MDGETHEGNKINLNYFSYLFMYKKLVPQYEKKKYIFYRNKGYAQ